jgi:superfamily II DNA/RNA helicase
MAHMKGAISEDRGEPRVRPLKRCSGLLPHFGNRSQNQRERALASFRKGEVRTLVATDIAARGIDVDGISHMVNFDLPNVPETYVHRIGRTAQAGAEGIAISHATPRRQRSCVTSRN